MAFCPRCGARQDAPAPAPRRVLSGAARDDSKLRERLAAKQASNRLTSHWSAPETQSEGHDSAEPAEIRNPVPPPLSSDDRDKQDKFARALALVADESPSFENLRAALDLFESVGDYRSAIQKAEQCRQALREPLYAEAQELAATQQLDKLAKAAEIFASLGSYRDSQTQADNCAQMQIQLRYDQAEDLFARAKTSGEYRTVLGQYQSLGDYRDALNKVAMCQSKIATADRGKHKTRRRLLVLGYVLAVVVGLAGLTVAFWRPVARHIEYVKADRLLAERHYLEAQQAFTALNGYSDSEDKIRECQEGLKDQAYSRAEKLLMNRDFSGAMRAFAELGDYRDSRLRLQECGESAAANAYSLAVKAMDAGDYAEAQRQLLETGDLYDSLDRRRECEYQLGLQKFEAGDLVNARPLLLRVGNYKDSLDLLNRCSVATLETALADLQVGGTLIMGRNPQLQTNTYEALTWTVLERDENSLLVLAQNAVDCRVYNPDSSQGLTWSDCELRRWLNGEFFSEAFSPGEQAYIVTNLLDNPSSNLRNKEIYGGPATVDKVFLLSTPEVDRLLGNPRDRVCRFSDYAAERGSRVDRLHDAQGSWWLRSPGADSNTAMRVEFDGSLGYDRFDVIYGVRPAMRVAFDPAYARRQAQALNTPQPKGAGHGQTAGAGQIKPEDGDKEKPETPDGEQAAK